MSVLLLRLAGPLQSWGTQSRFSHRDTGFEPSKSGVVGLIGAALGVERDDERRIAQLADLRMGVRVDREGRMLRDYHTALDVARSDGSGKQPTVLSERFYLADADFLIGLEGDPSLLVEIHGSIDRPVWPLFLGRKSFVPSPPITASVVDGALVEILRGVPWVGRPSESTPPRLRFVWDVPFGQGQPRQDVPITFAPPRYRVRHVQIEFHPTVVKGA